MCGGDSSAGSGGNGPTNPNPSVSRSTSNTNIGNIVGSILGALSPVPGGAQIGGRLGKNVGGRLDAPRNPSDPRGRGFFGGSDSGGDGSLGRTREPGSGSDSGTVKKKILKPGQAPESAAPAPAVAPLAAVDPAAGEADRLRASVRGGRSGTILAGRKIAEEKRRKTLLGE